MLQSMRNGAKTWVAKILFGLLVLSFAGWGVQGVFSSEQDPEIVSIGNQSVRMSEVAAAFQQSANQMRSLFGPDFTLQQAVQFGFLDRAIDQLLDTAIFSALTASLGVSVTDATVASEIQNNSAFQGPNGSFDRNAFEIALNRAGYTEERFVAAVRDDISRRHVVNNLQSGIELPTTYAKRLASYRLEKRIITRATINADDIQDITNASSTVLTNFYNENLDLFKTAEIRSFRLLDLTAETIARSIIVSEDDIVAEFEFRAPDLGSPEERVIIQVLVNDETQAKEIAARARSGEDFSAITASLNLPAPMSLGAVKASDLTAEVSTAAFAGKIGAIIGPVKSSFGWHVITVTDITEGKPARLEDHRADIAVRLAEESLFDVTSAVEQGLDEALHLAEIAQRNNLPLIEVANVNSSGYTAAADGLSTTNDSTINLGANARDILAIAFETEKDANSGIIDGSTSGYFVVEVSDIQPERQLSQNEATDAVRGEWMKVEQAKRAHDIAENLVKATKNGSDLADAHPAVTVKTHEPMTRDARQSNLSSADVEAAFALDDGEATVVETDNRNVHVVKIDEIIPATNAEIADAITTERDNYRNSIRDDILLQVRNRVQLDLGAFVDRKTARAFYVDPAFKDN